MLVPPQDDVDRVLGPIHEERVQAINMPTLRDELKKNGFTSPKIMGGLERACNLCLNINLKIKSQLITVMLLYFYILYVGDSLFSRSEFACFLALC